MTDRTLIVGASGGIGSALAAEFSSRGREVTGLSRSADGLDITDEASVEHHLTAQSGPFGTIVVATGVLETPAYTPEKAIAQVTADGLAEQFRVNAIGPMLVLKHALPLLPERGRAVIAVLSARVGSIGDNRIGGWHGYRAAKAALNQLMHGAAVELGRTHPDAILLCLHPGTVETPFTAKYAARHRTVPATEAAANLADLIDRAGPEHSGGFYDYAFEGIPW